MLRSPAAEATFVADELRRAHMVDGVPWNRMAVLVRSPAGSGPALRRGLATAGVPVSGSTELAVASQPLVVALLAALRAGADPGSMTPEAAVEFLGSPLGGFDVIALRRLRRAVRTACPDGGRAAVVIADVLGGERNLPPGLPPDLAGMLTRAASLLAQARFAAAGPAEDALWRLWARSGLSRRLAAASERGGREGQRADAHARRGRGTVRRSGRPGRPVARGRSFGVAGTRCRATGSLGRDGSRGSARGVALLSAHAAKGLEWDTVVVRGRPTGALARRSSAGRSARPSRPFRCGGRRTD